MLGATTWYRAWRNDYPRMLLASWSECARAFRESIWGLLLIVLVLGGIYSGAVHADRGRRRCRGLCLHHRRVRLQRTDIYAEVPAVLLKAASMSAMILYIITNAVVFSWLC